MRNNEKEKIYSRVKFNYIDFLIIIILLMALLSLFFKANIERAINKYISGNSARVLFSIDNIEDDILGTFKNDDKVFYSGGEFGILKSFKVDNSTDMILVSEKSGYNSYEFTKAKNKSTYCVSGEIIIEGSKRDNGFYLGGNDRVAVGMDFFVTIGNCAYKISVTGIEY